MNVIVVGGGFAGVRAALMLDKYDIGDITLISDEDYFLHHATLYSTATGHAREESVLPLKDIFAGRKNVKVVKDKMTSVDIIRKLVVGKERSYKYDKLVIAIGSVTTFFDIGGMAKHAYGIKSLNEVKKFSRHLQDEIIENQHLDKNYFVVGCGPTGVELAAALKGYLEYLKTTHKNTKGRVNVSLVEAADRVLPGLSKTASKKIAQQLKDIGVRVILKHKVESLSDDKITIEGKKIPTETAIWTSGTANNPFFAKHNDIFHLNEHGRVNVDRYLEAHEDIFVIGDNNSTKYSGMAWPAIREATFVAKHLKRLKNHSRLRPFRPIRPIQAIPVGQGWGYVEWFGVYVAGRAGFWLRRIIELAGYLWLLPAKTAFRSWQAHNLRERG